ncbi:MAG: hypothetical protein KIT11_09250 [Fimbriimonadaceae bacterium]|nr:hypothetical protein [Fimbriimonadaceae bacterium]QYK55514.1 MAG: hypothetical protein KF733_10920 [Fimbriimonadaceae bacterium]
MNKEFYKRLVDLYAGNELTEELTAEMEQAAMSDPDLAADMFAMKKTVETIQGLPQPEMTAESDVRIRLLMRMRGAEVQETAPSPSFWQYHLPIQS